MPPDYLKQYKRKKGVCKDKMCFCLKCLSLEPKMTFAAFEKHVIEKHRGSGKKCPWCYGDYTFTKCELSKPSSESNKHRVKCFMKFKEQASERTPGEPILRPPSDEFSALIPEAPLPPACEICTKWFENPDKQNMMKRKVNTDWKETGFYDDIDLGKLIDLDERSPHRVHFQKDSGLEDGVFNILQAFQNDKSLKWMHLMVKAITWSTFKSSMLLMKHKVQILPYWSLCDGSKNTENPAPNLLHHRHMILVTRDEKEFLKKWRQDIRLDEIRCKTMKEIETAAHLVNTLFYVSNGHGSCTGEYGKLSHYWIRRPMYPHARIAMSLLYENGINDYLRIQFLNKNIGLWRDLVHDNRIRLDHIEIEPWMCTLPVENNLMPLRLDTLENGEPYLHLIEPKHIMVLQTHVPGDQTHSEWISLQREMGNYFFGRLGYSYYVLSHQQRKEIRALKRAKRQNDLALKEMRDKMLKEQRDKEFWETRYHEVKTEYKKLKTENKKVKRENKKLKTANSNLKTKLAKFQFKNVMRD